MKRSPIHRNSCFLRGLAAILCLQLALPNPALALRISQPESENRRSGLEESLGGLEEKFVSQDAQTSEHLRTEFQAGRMKADKFVDAVLAPFHKVPEPPPGLAAAGYGPLGVPVDDSWVPMLRRFSEGEIVRATDQEGVWNKAREAVGEFLSRIGGDVVPGRPLRGMSDNVAIEMMLELMRVATGTMDPYTALKEEYNELALAHLDKMEQAIAELTDPVPLAVALGIIGNAIDFAAAEQRLILERDGFPFEAEIAKARGLSFVVDQRPDFLAALEANPQGEVLFLVDNAGEIVLDLPLIKLLLQQGRQVTVAGKSLPHANDMTADDLRALFAEKRVRNFIGADRMSSLQIIASGTAMTGLDLRRATPELAAAWRRAPIIYAKGQGMIETLRYAPLSRDVFHAVMVKDATYFHETGLDGQKLPLKKNDVLFLHTPAAEPATEASAGGLEEETELDRLIREVPEIVPAGSAPEVGRPGRHRLGQFLASAEEGRTLRTFISWARALRRKRERPETNLRPTEEILSRLEKRAARAFSEEGPLSEEDLPWFARLLIRLSGSEPVSSISYPAVSEKQLKTFAKKFLDRETEQIPPLKVRPLLYSRAMEKAARAGRNSWVQEMAVWYFNDRFPNKAVKGSDELPAEVVEQAFLDIEAAIRHLPDYKAILKSRQPPIRLRASLADYKWAGAAPRRPPRPPVSDRRRGLASGEKSRVDIANEWAAASGALVLALRRAAPAEKKDPLVGPGTRIQLTVRNRLASAKIPLNDLEKWVKSVGAWRGFLVERVDREAGTIQLIQTGMNPNGTHSSNRVKIGDLPAMSEQLKSLAADEAFLARLWTPLNAAGPATEASAGGLEEDTEGAGEGVPLFDGAPFAAANWISFLLGYLQQAVLEKKMPLQVQLSGPNGSEEILLPLPGGATDPSEKGARSTEWDPDVFRRAFRQIGVVPENNQESWTVTLDEMGGEFHFRFAPHEAGGSSSLGLRVSVADDFEEEPEYTENPAQNQWGLFSWGNQEPNWLGEPSWEESEQLYKGPLQGLVNWLGDQSVSNWREKRGISKIEIVFPDNRMKIKGKTHQLDENTDIHWIAERMGKELVPLAGTDAAYEAVLIRNLVRIRPVEQSGLEEGRGYVAVGPVGLLVPPDLPADSYYAVAAGLEQAAVLKEAGRDPRRMIVVATTLEEVSALTALGIPGDQIVQARDWPTPEAAKHYAVELGKEWLAGLNGLRVSVLEVTARTAQGVLAQLRELLPSGWQAARPITAEDAQQALRIAV